MADLVLDIVRNSKQMNTLAYGWAQLMHALPMCASFHGNPLTTKWMTELRSSWYSPNQVEDWSEIPLLSKQRCLFTPVGVKCHCPVSTPTGPHGTWKMSPRYKWSTFHHSTITYGISSRHKLHCTWRLLEKGRLVIKLYTFFPLPRRHTLHYILNDIPIHFDVSFYTVVLR